jgi:multimeric flavodoxin WrbA
MKIAVVFGSQRHGGTHGKIEEMMRSLEVNHDFDFIRMEETKINACIACEECTHTGRCVLPPSKDDMFQNVLDRLIGADAIVIITPVYAPIPSRLTALFERLLSISFFSHEIGKLERPLKGKRTAVISYDSGSIGDETQIKMIFQRFLMDDYSFTEVDYAFENNVQNPNERFENVIEYARGVILNLS